MKKKLISVLICIMAMFAFSGCAFVFDTLNFSTDKLPNPESVVDPNLKNPYIGVQGAVTLAQFSDIIDKTETRMNGFCDEVATYNWVNNPIVLINSGNNAAESRYMVKELAYMPDIYANNETPYASFGQQFSEGSIDNVKHYFFKDNFLVAYAKYSNDTYLENINPYEYDNVQRGSFILRTLKSFKQYFGSVDKEFQNGKEVFFLKTSANAAQAMEIADFDFSLIGQTADDFLGMSAAYTLSDGIIKSLSIGYTFKNETLGIEIKSNSIGNAEISGYGNIDYITGTGYEYYINQQADKVFDAYRNLILFQKPMKAEITNTVYDVQSGQFKSESYTVYSTKQTVAVTYPPIDASFGKTDIRRFDTFVYTAVLEDGTKIHYYYFNSGYLVVEKDGILTEIFHDNVKNQNDEFNKYFKYIYNCSALGDAAAYVYNSTKTTTYRKDGDNHTIELSYTTPLAYDTRTKRTAEVVLRGDTHDIIDFKIKNEILRYDLNDLGIPPTIEQEMDKDNISLAIEYVFDAPVIPASVLEITIQN